MLKIVGIVVVVLIVAVAAVVAYASTRPDTFRVQRSTSIKAPPEKIFSLINDYRNWPQWSPYENRDPDMKRTFSGAASGKGAKYAWQGNKNVGSGEMEIIDTAPPNKILVKLDFMTPFEAHNIAEFTLEPRGDATNVTTNVTWAMQGPVPLMGKGMHMVMDVDKMVGNDFAAGLETMKAAAEK
ncbi:MAG: SRPBCC family protein [Xanthobacteraceae bacterium]